MRFDRRLGLRLQRQSRATEAAHHLLCTTLVNRQANELASGIEDSPITSVPLNRVGYLCPLCHVSPLCVT